MDIKILIRKILAQTKNTYTINNIANLAKKMKDSNARNIPSLWEKFQTKYKVTKDKVDYILIDKLKGTYQLDLKSTPHREALDTLISDLKKRKTWT